MHIGILTISVNLPGCGSLKEKRQRMGGIHERYGRNPSVAVCESGMRDRQDASEWTFVIATNSSQETESLCSEIEDRFQRTVDARIQNVAREFL